MRIAVISTPSIASWGGSEELWASMVDEALTAGHTVAISPRHDLYSPPDRLLALEKRGAKLLSKPVHTDTTDTLDQLAHYRQLFDPTPDVVLINNGGGYEELFEPSLLDALRELSVPYVVSCRLISETGFIKEKDREKATNFLCRARYVVYPARLNHITAQRHLAKALPSAVVLHSPANLDEFGCIDWPLGNAVHFASVARLEPVQKGQDILFEALHSPLWMSRSWRLSLYGSGIRHQYLKDLARYYGIEARVEFRGVVKDVRSIWRQSHLLVLPSRDEGAPIALIEAMLCGRPSVVTNVGGNAEWVKDGETGFVADAPSARFFGDALERAWQAKSRWPEIGRCAHERASALYDKNAGATLLKCLVACAKIG